MLSSGKLKQRWETIHLINLAVHFFQAIFWGLALLHDKFIDGLHEKQFFCIWSHRFVVLTRIWQNITELLLNWVQLSMARASLCFYKCGKLSPFLPTHSSWRINYKTDQVTWTHVDVYAACEFMNWKSVCVQAGVLSVSAEIGTPPIRRRVSILFARLSHSSSPGGRIWNF